MDGHDEFLDRCDSPSFFASDVGARLDDCRAHLTGLGTRRCHLAPSDLGCGQEDLLLIQGVHTMFYSDEAAALRAFIRDKLGFPAHDVGGGWLIFDLASANLGVHPTDPGGKQGKVHGAHDISFYCDDIAATVAELKTRGVEFASEVEDHGWGLVTRFRMPGEVEVMLYQPAEPK